MLIRVTESFFSHDHPMFKPCRCIRDMSDTMVEVTYFIDTDTGECRGTSAYPVVQVDPDLWAKHCAAVGAKYKRL